MTVYIVAQLKFTDRPTYDRYQAAFWTVFKGYDGRLLAADERPSPIEGDWPFEKIVILAFPDEERARRFHDSHEYQAIAADRKAGAETTSVLVHGFGP